MRMWPTAVCDCCAPPPLARSLTFTQSSVYITGVHEEPASASQNEATGVCVLPAVSASPVCCR